MKDNLSKSKYCNGLQCQKMLWLDTYKSELKEEVNNESVFDNGISVGSLAKNLFGSHIDIEFNNDLNVMLRKTEKYLKEDKIVITEASFLYDNNFCSVDILVKNGDDLSIYEVKSSTEIKDIYVEDLAYQVFVLKKLGYNISSSSLVYINSNYIRYGELELDKLFNIEDLTEIINGKLNEVENNIKKIKSSLLENKEPTIDLGIHCVTPYECPFFKYCTKSLPLKNVFNIRGMSNSKKFNLNYFIKNQLLIKIKLKNF